jgi:ribosomal protein L35AE/L33A
LLTSDLHALQPVVAVATDFGRLEPPSEASSYLSTVVILKAEDGEIFGGVVGRIVVDMMDLN